MRVETIGQDFTIQSLLYLNNPCEVERIKSPRTYSRPIMNWHMNLLEVESYFEFISGLERRSLLASAH
ncbi:MAG: hypothetical protein QF437_31400, partial [Planctomycetota bacterium]|nr:hypothetical protein [Planctomycetota bacterium]